MCVYEFAVSDFWQFFSLMKSKVACSHQIKMAVQSSECSSSFEAAHVFGRKISWFSNPSKNKKQATDSFPLVGAAQSMNDARLAQKDLNKSRLSDLVNIGQGVGRSAMDALGTSAANETARKNAYQQELFIKSNRKITIKKVFAPEGKAGEDIYSRKKKRITLT